MLRAQISNIPDKSAIDLYPRHEVRAGYLECSNQA